MTLSRVFAACTVVVAFAGVGAAPSQAQGVNCTISATGVAYGTYNVFSTSPTDSIGTITYQCTVGVFIRINLSRGSSSSFAPRTLRSGSELLNYNLYLDAAYSTIWGDGSNATSFLSETLLALQTKNASVFGRIPSLQDAAVGSYSDSVVATIVF